MSIQLTLKNPFAWRAKADAVRVFDRLIESISADSKQLQFIKYGKACSLSVPGCVSVRADGEQTQPPRLVLATLLVSGTAIHLLAIARRHENIHLELASNNCVMASLRLGDDSDPVYKWEEVWDHPQTRSALEVFERAAQRSGSRFSLKAWLPWLVCLFGLGVSALLALGAGAAGNAAASATRPAPAAVDPSPSQASVQDMLDASDRKILARAVAEAGIALDPSVKGKPFVVFSDPNCPACQALEKTLQTLDRTQFTPIVVPVSFKDGSAEKVAALYCAADMAAAWAKAASAQPGPGPAPSPGSCTKGEAMARNSNAAFVALRLNQTPTIVAPNGRIVAGTGSPEQVATWLRSNM